MRNLKLKVISRLVEPGSKTARHWRLTPVLLATQEAENRKAAVRSQPRQIVHEILPRKTHHKKGGEAGRVTQGVGHEFKPQYCKKKKKKDFSLQIICYFSKVFLW
jgi:hypothetical protein